MLTPTGNILIIRLSAIGDVVMSTALLPPLKRAHPNCKLYWLAESAANNLLKDHPDIDEVIVFPKQPWQKLWQQKRYLDLAKEVRAFIKILRNKNITLALDAQGLLKSGLWAWLCGAKQRIGLNSKEGSQWLMTTVLKPNKNSPLISSEYEHLAQYLQLDTQSFFMHLPLTSAQQIRAKNILIAAGVNTAKPYIVACPFTTRPQKHWPDHHWQTLLHDLLNTYAGAIVILGGRENSLHANKLLADLNHQTRIINLTGLTQLPDASAIIHDAQVLIGVDTGLTHMGIAHNTPTLAIFGSTRPYTITRRNNTQVFFQKMACAPCRRNPVCHGQFTCMHAILPSTILANTKRFMQQSITAQSLTAQALTEQY